MKSATQTALRQLRLPLEHQERHPLPGHLREEAVEILAELLLEALDEEAADPGPARGGSDES